MTAIQNDSTDLKGPGIGLRHGQSLLLFLCGVVTYWTRINVSVAIVAMTNEDSNPGGLQIFKWNEQEKGFILSTFFWGYVITQLPAGQLGQKFGTKIILLIAILFPSILTILTPISVNYGGWKVFCVIRAIQGLFAGAIFPLMHIHLSKWAPLEERNLLGGFAYSGVQLGTILAFLLSGLVASTSLGWPGIFYIPGMVGVLWSITWIIFGANCPSDARSIREAERKYIESLCECSTESSKIPIPWTKIITSVPFIALICTRMSNAWGGATILNEIPTYMNSVLKLDMKSNAFFTALPFTVMFGLGFIFLFLADFLTTKKYISITMLRKTFNTIAEFGPALALIGFAFVTSENIPLAVTVLTLAVSLKSSAVLGSSLNHIDLSPNYAGILMGIANTFSNIISIIVPLIIGQLVTDETDQSQWQYVFFMAAAVYFFGNSIYIIFGKMERQSWDKVELQENPQQSFVFEKKESNAAV